MAALAGLALVISFLSANSWLPSSARAICMLWQTRLGHLPCTVRRTVADSVPERHSYRPPSEAVTSLKVRSDPRAAAEEGSGRPSGRRHTVGAGPVRGQVRWTGSPRRAVVTAELSLLVSSTRGRSAERIGTSESGAIRMHASGPDCCWERQHHHDDKYERVMKCASTLDKNPLLGNFSPCHVCSTMGREERGNLDAFSLNKMLNDNFAKLMLFSRRLMRRPDRTSTLGVARDIEKRFTSQPMEFVSLKAKENKSLR